MFNFNDYDCIGFDLDNTVCEYRELELIQLVYDILSNYLVTVKKYDPEIIRPLDIDFLRKGLTLDLEKGNILDLADDGTILRASHGTKPLTDAEIESIYGENKQWKLASHHCKDFLATWNGEFSEKIRSSIDYFDVAVPLLFARVIDSVDKGDGRRENYRVWPDILSGLFYMFVKEHFPSDKGEYYPALKYNPDKYIRKCSPKVINWLEEMKKAGKTTFLITGSNSPYGSFIAETALGPDWKKYFDVIIYYARKPGFFVQKRPFCSPENEDVAIPLSDFKFPGSYSQGNWSDLFNLLAKTTGKTNPKCVYVGDNLVQDVYTPSLFKDCDTVAVVKELTAECDNNDELLVSKRWGSFFYDKQNNKYTVWGSVIRNHAKICIPDLTWLATKPFDTQYPEFQPSDRYEYDRKHLSGYQEFIPTCFL